MKKSTVFFDKSLGITKNNVHCSEFSAALALHNEITTVISLGYFYSHPIGAMPKNSILVLAIDLEWLRLSDIPESKSVQRVESVISKENSYVLLEVRFFEKNTKQHFLLFRVSINSDGNIFAFGCS